MCPPWPEGPGNGSSGGQIGGAGRPGPVRPGGRGAVLRADPGPGPGGGEAGGILPIQEKMKRG